MTKRFIKRLSFFLLIYSWSIVHAEPEYPVDISYMVSDFKYSREHGLKICEVQHGVLSALNGDRYVTGGEGCIPPVIADFFNQFPINKWVGILRYSPLKNELTNNGWKNKQSIKLIVKDPAFLSCAALPPEDIYSIDSYAGIVFSTSQIINDLSRYRSNYPGILFVDAAILPYWIDKYKMNALFNLNDDLKGYKADWELYPKKYDPLLAERIQEKMPSELYVIKPRYEFLGKGVIVVERKDLDRLLRKILEPKASLKEQSDQRLSYWYSNKDDTFLIEKYYPSDYLHFSHKLSELGDALPLDDAEDYHYDATMRIAFILKHDKGIMTYHYLGSYWKLPCKAQEEQGTLNEKSISFGSPPFYRAVDPELLDEVNAALEKAMLLLYGIILDAEAADKIPVIENMR